MVVRGERFLPSLSISIKKVKGSGASAAMKLRGIDNNSYSNYSTKINNTMHPSGSSRTYNSYNLQTIHSDLLTAFLDPNTDSRWLIYLNYVTEPLPILTAVA